jgi:hypothetical protein
MTKDKSGELEVVDPDQVAQGETVHEGTDFTGQQPGTEAPGAGTGPGADTGTDAVVEAGTSTGTGTDSGTVDGTDSETGTETTGLTEIPADVIIIHASPATDPAEAALQARLKAGDATPEEALNWFQAHGFPQLTGLPRFLTDSDGETGIWLFPDTAGGGTRTAIAVADPGTSRTTGTTGSEQGSAGGTGTPTGSAPDGAADSGSSGAEGTGAGSVGGAGSSGSVGTDSVAAPTGSGGAGSVAVPVSTPAPAPGASAPPPPVPGSVAADFATGMAIGRVHGAFLADADRFMSTLKAEHDGASLWEIMTPAERADAVERIQREFLNLPQLPKGVDAAHDKALHDGYNQTAGNTYSAERWVNKAVAVGFELLQNAIIGAAAAPTTVGIGAVSSERWSDCAAQTASLAIESATGNPAIEASMLRANFGLPRVATSYSEAVSYAKNWFTALGITLSPTNAIQDIERGRAAAGDYVMFMRGGQSGGHVVFVSVKADGLMVIRDGQIGLQWPNLMLAQNSLGMQASGAFRIESINPP